MSRKPLRIGIEAKLLCSPLTGIGRVVSTYVLQLQKLDSDNIYYVYTPYQIPSKLIKNQNWQNCYFSKLKSKYSILNNIRNLFFNFFFSLLARKHDLDVLIVTSTNAFPLYMPKKNIKLFSIIYDSVWKLFPETMSIMNRYLLTFTIPKKLRKSYHLIAISQSVADEMQTLFQSTIPVSTIPLAADTEVFYPCNAESGVLKKYGIRKRYILSVCTVEPRKNLHSLLRAFSKIQDRDQYCLVLCGQKGWGKNDYETTIKDLGIEDDVLFTGYVLDEELAPLYSGAEMFIFPSLYEGFGLPILEAMQCGCPVITSNVSSMPEVGGNAALYVNPTNIEELTSTIEQVLVDSGLKDRLSIAGLERAKEFSWRKSSELLIGCINNSFKTAF